MKHCSISLLSSVNELEHEDLPGLARLLLSKRLEPEKEKRLIEDALRETSAFQELFEHYFPKVYAYVNYRVSRVQDAEDLVASVFTKVTERLDKFQWRGPGSFAAWLFRIAHDHVIDFYRRNHKAIEVVSLEDIPNIHSNTLLPDESVMQKEKFARLRQLIGTISPRRQEVITLKFFAGLRNKEIAFILSLDERTVSSHLCRGLEELHQRYLKENAEPRKEDVYG